MSKIETGRWSEQLRRMLGMSGATIVAAELSPEVSPTIELVSADELEWSFLRSVRKSIASFQVTAAVGTLSIFRARNPAGSGCIVVLEHATVFANVANAALLLSVGASAVDIGGVVATGVRDSRWGPTGPTGQNVLLFSSTNAGAFTGTTTVWRARGLANTPFTYDLGIVLMPGDTLEGGSATTDVQQNWTVGWRERSLPDLETA